MRHTGLVPEYCTCGAQLPPDARFCHKCGKPQFDEPAIEEVPSLDSLPLAPPKAAAVPLEITFHNMLAVRTGFLAALIASMVTQLPLPMYVGFLWLLTGLMGAGFFAVFLYARRSGEHVSVRGGARMGWITGIFCFVIGTVMFTIGVLLVSSKGGLAQFFREMITSRAGGDPNVQQVLDMLSTPTGVGTLILLTLAAQFVLFTLLPMLGGALGAKVLWKD